MLLVKVLKRKDAVSVLVAILLAMIVSQPLLMMTGKPAGIISGLNNGDGGFGWYGYGPGGDWQSQYLFPIVWILVQILVLEILAWLYVFLLMLARKVRRAK